MLDYCRCQVHDNIGGKCLKEIFSKKVYDYSLINFGKPLCFDCQRHQAEPSKEAWNELDKDLRKEVSQEL